MNFHRKFVAGSAMFAVIMSSAAPSMAATSFSPEPVKASDAAPEYNETSEYYRRRRYRRNRVDAGDIIAGIGLIAGIAIIAGAASKSSKRDRRGRDYRNESQQRSQQSGPASDLGSAVAACSSAAEQSAGNGASVEEIRSANRNGNGWRVSGVLSDNRNFDCGVDSSGVDFVQLGGVNGAI